VSHVLEREPCEQRLGQRRLRMRRAPSREPARLQRRQERLQLRVRPRTHVVAPALVEIAGGARDREVVGLVAAAVVARHDVLDRGASDRRAVAGEPVLAPAVEAAPFPHRRLTRAHGQQLEGAVRGGAQQQPPACRDRAHARERSALLARGRRRGDRARGAAGSGG